MNFRRRATDLGVRDFITCQERPISEIRPSDVNRLMMDCYAVLGVRRDASQEEIKDAFRKRALECHPDQAADGDVEAAKEEFLRVRKAFELLSDPQKRAAYDANGSDAVSVESIDEVNVRRRSYKKAWRDAQKQQSISVSQAILDKVGGLSANYKTIRRRTSVTVPLFSLLGTVLFVLEPGAIYASNVFLIDLLLCTALGGVYGFIVGNAWGYADLFLQRRREQS